MFLLRAVLNILVRNASPRGPMCFRCLIFNLSGPCELLFLLIQTFLFKVVGPGLVSTSPAFVSSNASHPAGPHGRHAQNTVNRAPIAGGGDVRHNLHSSLSSL